MSGGVSIATSMQWVAVKEEKVGNEAASVSPEPFLRSSLPPQPQAFCLQAHELDSKPVLTSTPPDVFLQLPVEGVC